MAIAAEDRETSSADSHHPQSLADPGEAAKSVRGRPRLDRHISDALLQAAEAGLRVKSHTELTSREIAALAGTTPAMIKYYFGGKDGLFSALIEGALREASGDLERFEASLETIEGSPTKALLKLLARHYYSRAPLFKIVMDEVRNRNSDIRRRYLARASRTHTQVCRIIRKLVASGIYAPDTNIRHAVFLLTCVISTPVTISPVIDQFGVSLAELAQDPWLDYVTRMLEREFGVGRGSAGAH